MQPYSLCDAPDPNDDNNKNKKSIITGANFTLTFELFYVILDTGATNHDINTQNTAVFVCHSISMASVFDLFQKHVMHVKCTVQRNPSRMQKLLCGYCISISTSYELATDGC